MDAENNTHTPADDGALDRLALFTRLLDDRFRIPGTRIRFGIDAVAGLVPYLGDLLGLAMSALMFHAMWRHGAGPLMLLRMLGNVLTDTIVGMVPVLGDVFDVAFKANRRNLNLLAQYYEENPERPRLGQSMLVIGVLFLLVFVCIIWLTFSLLQFVWSGIVG